MSEQTLVKLIESRSNRQLTTSDKQFLSYLIQDMEEKEKNALLAKLKQQNHLKGKNKK